MKLVRNAMELYKQTVQSVSQGMIYKPIIAVNLRFNAQTDNMGMIVMFV